MWSWVFMAAGFYEEMVSWGWLHARWESGIGMLSLTVFPDTLWDRGPELSDLLLKAFDHHG